jgi:SOS response associated peptidase (SRAP)
MCGRARLSSDVSEIKLVFSIPPHWPTPNFAPSWNVAPTDQLPIVRFDAKARERSLDLMRWGLVPYWAKDLKVGFANINAKAEGIEGRPAFREAFQRRRCLVPVYAPRSTTGCPLCSTHSVARLACRDASRPAAAQNLARALPLGGGDPLAGERARGHVRNNDPSLIAANEPA